LNDTLDLALAAARDKNAENPIALDLQDISAFTDFFLICSGRNQRHVQAISNEIEAQLVKRKIKPRHIEGYRNAEWVLLDFIDVVVHIFNRDRRMFLQLERLWGDARRLDIGGDDLETEGASAIDNRGGPR
jgi:ribosome-associated protein